jgi:hypothetical protein
MTNATKSLLIVFVSLLLLTALVKWNSTPSSSEAFRTTLVDVDAQKVDRISIEQPAANRTLVLMQTPSGWTVSEGTGGETFEADSGFVQRALDDLTGLQVKAVVTRNPEKFTRYKVDSTGTLVSLYEGEELLESVVIGAPQFVSQREFNNYVRPSDEETVYAVEGFLESTFNRELDRWRETQVWDIDRDDIVRIDLMLPADSSYSIERIDEGWVSGTDTLSQTQIATVLSRLASLNANGFVDSLAVSDFGTERYAIQLRLENGSDRLIKLKPDERDDTYYVATATDFPYVFKVYKSSWENSVLQSKEELLD